MSSQGPDASCGTNYVGGSGTAEWERWGFLALLPYRPSALTGDPSQGSLHRTQDAHL